MQELFAAVGHQIELSGRPVKAAAILHFARVASTLDRTEAERMLEQGIALSMEMPEPDGPPLMSQAVYLAAAVSPQRAFDLLSIVRTTRRTGGRRASFSIC